MGSKVGSANLIKTMKISMQVMAPSKINEHHNSFSHNRSVENGIVIEKVRILIEDTLHLSRKKTDAYGRKGRWKL